MLLIDKLENILGSQSAQADHDPYALQLASTVLLVEISHADFVTDKRELEVASARLAQCYGLTRAEVDSLLADALVQHRESVSLHEYLTVINRHMAPEEKIRLVEDLWFVAYADDKLDCHEEHQIRKIANLLHVPHVYFVRGRHRAENSGRGDRR